MLWINEFLSQYHYQTMLYFYSLWLLFFSTTRIGQILEKGRHRSFLTDLHQQLMQEVKGDYKHTNYS